MTTDDTRSRLYEIIERITKLPIEKIQRTPVNELRKYSPPSPPGTVHGIPVDYVETPGGTVSVPR